MQWCGMWAMRRIGRSQIDHMIICVDCGINTDLCFTQSEEYVCLQCVEKREEAGRLQAYVDNEDPKWFEQQEQLRDLQSFQRIMQNR
jgi:hypothetical protein